MFLAPENIQAITKRVRQIANEIDSEYINEYSDMSLEVLAFRLKLLAYNFNCYIQSWISGAPEDVNKGVVECYNAEDYNEENEDTWELITAPTEPEAIIVAFKWLADKQYFKGE